MVGFGRSSEGVSEPSRCLAELWPTRVSVYFVKQRMESLTARRCIVEAIL